MQEWLLCLDPADDSLGRAKQVAAFAKANGNQLRALVAMSSPRGAYGPGSEVMLATLRAHWANLRHQAEETQQRCQQDAGIPTMLLETTPDRVIVDTASAMRPHDLIICTQPTLDRSFVDDDLFEAVLFVSGRPALILPRDLTAPLRAQRVLIAWKNCREAARVIHDAVPILQRADSVTLLSVKPTAEDAEICRPAQEAMTEALVRRSVRAVAHSIVAGKGGTSEIIHKEAQAADMLVMGGYGHYRWSEILFGGVTRHILENMTFPVLMAR